MVKDPGLRFRFSVRVERAADGEAAAIEDVGVDHRRADVLMAEQFLDGADIVAVFEEVGGERVAEGMAGDPFLNFGLTGGGADRFLERAAADVVAASDAGARVLGQPDRGEDILPDPFPAGPGVLPVEGGRQEDMAEPKRQVRFVAAFRHDQVFLEGGVQCLGQHRDPVLGAFAIADHDQGLGEIQVFDPEADTFGEAQAAAVEQLAHQLIGEGEEAEDGFDFIFGEHCGQAFGAFSAQRVEGQLDLQQEHFLVEEEEGAEGLVLGRGSDIQVHGEVSEKRFDLGPAKLAGVALVMEKDIAGDPAQVRAFGMQGVMLAAQGLPDLIEEPGRGRSGGHRA